jgi:hypothetical protein
MRTGHLRTRYVVPVGLLALVLAVFGGPVRHLDGGPDRLSVLTAATLRVVAAPTAAHSTPHLVRSEPASTVLPLAAIAGLAMLVAGGGWLEQARRSRPARDRLLAALRRGRSPPPGLSSLASAGR